MRKVLVVVDYQKDFVDGSLGFEGAEKLDKGIAKKIREYGQGNVIYTLDTHPPYYLETREGKALPVEHCIVDRDGVGTEGHRVYGATDNALREVNALPVAKETFGVGPTMIMLVEKFFKNVDAFEFVGLVSNICVLSNAVVFQAAYPQAQIVVDASLTDSFNKDLHEKTLDILEGLQVKVINR